MSAARPHFEVVVIGTGFAGIGAAIELKRNGIEDFVILEKADDIGGTWRDNDYPELSVDVLHLPVLVREEPGLVARLRQGAACSRSRTWG